MAYYRLYFMDVFSGHIRNFRDFEADNDDAAIELAEDWRGLSRSELWCRHRKVKSWPPNFRTPADKAAE